MEKENKVEVVVRNGSGGCNTTPTCKRCGRSMTPITRFPDLVNIGHKCENCLLVEENNKLL